MPRRVDAPDTQYCSYCGRELIIWKRKSALDVRDDFVYLRCPKRHWWNQLHVEILVRVETSDTVLNYDPITGERIKK